MNSRAAKNLAMNLARSGKHIIAKVADKGGNLIAHRMMLKPNLERNRAAAFEKATFDIKHKGQTAKSRALQKVYK